MKGPILACVVSFLIAHIASSHEDAQHLEGTDDEIISQIRQRLPSGYTWKTMDNGTLEQQLWQIIDQVEKEYSETVSTTLYKELLHTATHDGVRSELTMERIRNGLKNRFPEISGLLTGSGSEESTKTIQRTNSFTGEIEFVSENQISTEKETRFYKAFSELYLNTLALHGTSSDLPILEEFRKLEDPHFSHLAEFATLNIAKRQAESSKSPDNNRVIEVNPVPIEKPETKNFSPTPTETAPSKLPWILGAIALLAIVVILVRATRSKDHPS